MTSQEQEAVLCLCMMAAFADGQQADFERAELRRVASTLPAGSVNLAAIYQKVLLGQARPAAVAATLQTPAARQLAYELAVGVCEADDLLNESERAFLEGLRRDLRLDRAATGEVEHQAEALTRMPVEVVETAPAADSGGVPASAVAMPAVPAAAVGGPADVADAELDGSILRHSLLAGALELMPDSLATMAIIPLQMKLVHGVGKRFGYSLDRGHIKELLAAAGVGLTSQVVEGYARKLIGGLLGKAGGGLLRGVGKQAASSAMSFATTYALGHLAKRYYAGGRTLSALALREQFNQLAGQARGLYEQHAPAIEAQAGQTRMSGVLQMLQKV